MFEEDWHFNFFDYEDLTKDFCYTKPITLEFNIQDKQSSFKLRQFIEVKNYKCNLTDHMSMERRFG
jgi:hypothetical protein